MASKRARNDRAAEPDGAASSISPKTPVSQSTAEGFPAGAEVEVKFDRKGFYGAWFEARVLTSRLPWGRCFKYRVEFRTLLRSEGSQELLVEDVNEKDVRPRAPRRLNANAPSAGCTEDEDPNLRLHDLVEAYHNDGWWCGVLSGLRDPETGLYTVSFPSSREVFQFKPHEIRPKLAFINRKWVPVSGEETGGTFKEGDNVEVSILRDDYGESFFLAQVGKVIHNSYCLIKYESPYARPNGDLTEIIDPRYLRPAYIGSKTDKFMARSHVEFFKEGGWSLGVVSSCLRDSEYTVKYKYKGEWMIELFKVSNLRWQMRKRGRPSKEEKIKSGHSDKTITSDISLTERSEITPESTTSSSKKLKMERSEEIDEIQSPLQHKVAASIDLEPGEEVPINEINKVRPGSNKSNSSFSSINMRAVRKISCSRKMLTELKECHSKVQTGKRSSRCKTNLNGWKIDDKPLENQNDVDLSNESCSDSPHPNTNCETEAVLVGTFSCEEQHESITDGVAGINKGQLVELQTLDSNANTEHLPKNEDGIPNTASPEKLSPIWKTVEALEIFCIIPQQPHFKKLKSKNEEEMEGEAIGMMVTYNRLAESINSLPIDTEMTVFEKKFAALNSLEENGFFVDPIKNRLQYLLERKLNYTDFVLKRVELKTGLANKEQEVTKLRLSANGYDAKLEEIAKMFAKLEEEKKAVMMDRADVKSSLADGEQEIQNRIEEINDITMSLELSLKEFVSARSKPLT